VIINRRRHGDKIKGLVKIIQQEKYAYSDPILQFLESLRVDFDFDGAQAQLAECTLVLKGDYFLCNYTDEFVKQARFLVFETYCRIHQKIDIGGLAQKLMMEREDAELWIVNLIRSAQLDAKIDSTQGCVVMRTNFQSVYEKVIEKTKDLAARTHQLAVGMERMHEQASAAGFPDARRAEEAF